MLASNHLRAMDGSAIVHMILFGHFTNIFDVSKLAPSFRKEREFVCMYVCTTRVVNQLEHPLVRVLISAFHRVSFAAELKLAEMTSCFVSSPDT